MVHIQNLRVSIDQIVKHLKQQLTYQQELKFVRQNDSRMKAAEREINRLTYAFNILKQAGFPIIPVPPRQKKGEEEEKKEDAIDI